ncbi:MAG TPA: hypothetical protein QF873_00145 [Patescibacteria group bacterium]|nr:hypothetical protein [Patescibacteria group bacterium]
MADEEGRSNAANEELDEHADPKNFGIGAVSAPYRRRHDVGEPGRASRATMTQLADRQRVQQTGGDLSTVVPEIAGR